jgi:hypothetical protein
MQGAAQALANLHITGVSASKDSNDMHFHLALSIFIDVLKAHAIKVEVIKAALEDETSQISTVFKTVST